MGEGLGLARILADGRPLRVPEFRNLRVASIITVIGAQLTVVAVPAQIYEITGSSGYVGLTGLFGLVPLVGFGLYGGALADYFDRRTMLMVSTIGLIVTSFLFYLQAAADNRNVWLLLGLFSVQQAFFALNSPVRNAILPALIPAELLPAAVSLNMTVFVSGAVAGLLLAGVLIPVIGLESLYLIDTFTLLATLWAVLVLPRLPVQGTVSSPGLRSVIEGFSYLTRQPVLLMSFVVDLIAMVFGMPRALFPEMAHIEFGGPEAGGLAFAALYAAIPAGSLVGGVFSGWVSSVRCHGRAVALLIMVWGLAMVGFGSAVGMADGRLDRWLWIAVVALAAGGAADIASAAFRQSMLLEAADDALRGRLQGVFTVVVVGGPRIADVLHGVAADQWGPVITTVVGGAMVVMLVAIAIPLAPSFWRYDPFLTVQRAGSDR